MFLYLCLGFVLYILGLIINLLSGILLACLKLDKHLNAAYFPTDS